MRPTVVGLAALSAAAVVFFEDGGLEIVQEGLVVPLVDVGILVAPLALG